MSTTNETSPEAKRQKRPRVQLDFTPEAYERIKELKTMARADSIPDMFRDALRLFEWYQVRKKEGHRFLVQKDGKPVEVNLV
jgi:hypothetical protein